MGKVPALCVPTYLQGPVEASCEVAHALLEQQQWVPKL